MEEETLRCLHFFAYWCQFNKEGEGHNLDKIALGNRRGGRGFNSLKVNFKLIELSPETASSQSNKLVPHCSIFFFSSGSGVHLFTHNFK